MAEKSLLVELKEKAVNIEKILETDWLNLAIPQGSSSLDMGYISYPKDKVEALLDEVPSAFSYKWAFERISGRLKEKILTEEQEKVLMKINEVGGRHPEFHINDYTAAKMINVFEHCLKNYHHWQ